MRPGLLGYVAAVMLAGVCTIYYFHDIIRDGDQGSRFDEVLESLRRKDVQQWTQEELTLFMTSKNEIYSQRREKIRQKCIDNTVRPHLQCATLTLLLTKGIFFKWDKQDGSHL